MNNPSVSVIIPTYNRLRFLREALDSIHAQTFRVMETIVVDDGSQEEIAAGVADHPTRPRVIRQSRSGPAAARNRGLVEATGELIAFLDSDDLWLPDKMERYLSAMRSQPDVRIFYGPMSPIDRDRRPVPGRTKPCVGGWITQALFNSSFVHVPTIVCHRDVLVDSRGFNPSLPVCEDYELWLRLSVGLQFGLIDEPLALRRLHNCRLSKERMDRNLYVKARVLKEFYESGVANAVLDPEISRARLARVFSHAAKAALREGRYQQAIQLCRESRHYGNSRLAVAPMSLAAAAMSLIRSGKPEVALQPQGQ